MMVSSPLEWHKAPHILTNEQQHQTQFGKTKAAAQTTHEQHIPDKDETIKIKTKANSGIKNLHTRDTGDR